MKLVKLLPKGSYGTINYEYDSLGNIIKRGDNQFHYTPSNPYKLTSITTPTQTINLAYDNNGNITRKGNQSFKYDVENRLIEVIDKDITTTLTYDSDGGRIKKEVTNSEGHKLTSIYIGKLFEKQLNNGKESTTTHIYLGNQRIASITTQY